MPSRRKRTFPVRQKERSRNPRERSFYILTLLGSVFSPRVNKNLILFNYLSPVYLLPYFRLRRFFLHRDLSSPVRNPHMRFATHLKATHIFGIYSRHTPHPEKLPFPGHIHVAAGLGQSHQARTDVMPVPLSLYRGRYFIRRGLGPTLDISPFSMFHSSGNSSKLVLRKIRPNFVNQIASASCSHMGVI